MNRLFFIAASVFSIIAVSCKSDPVPDLQQPESKEIVFTACDVMSATVNTKASVITSLQSDGFYASATTGTSSETQLWNNAGFTYVSNQYKGDKYWPASNNGIHFYASNYQMTFNAGGCSVNNVNANQKDIVCAYLASPAWGESNELTFEHIFSRIGNVSVTAPTGYTVSNLNISFTPFVSGSYNLKTKEWSGKTTNSSSPVQTIATSPSNSNSNNLWFIPGTYTLTATYTLEKGTGEGRYIENFTKTASVSLQAGKLNTIQTTLPAGSATDILFTVTVTPWDNTTITAVFAS